jgi:hypothetical protein
MNYQDSNATHELNLRFFEQASTCAAQTKLMLRRVNTPAASELSEKADALFLEIEKLREQPRSV